MQYMCGLDPRENSHAQRGGATEEQQMDEHFPDADASSRHLGIAKFSRAQEAEPATRPAGGMAEPLESHGAVQLPPSLIPTTTCMPQSATLSEVSSLLSEFQVLLRHIVAFQLPGGQPTDDPLGAASQEGRPPQFPPGIHIDLLTRAPEQIASDGSLLQQLYSSVSVLSGLAAPATVPSIYLTAAFLRDRTSANAPAETKSMAHRVWLWVIVTALLALFFFIVTIMLLVHVDRGRRDIQQLEHARDEYQLVISAIDQAHNPNLFADCVKAFGSSDTSYQQRGADHQPLCDRFRDTLVRLQIARAELRSWNIVSDHLFFLAPRHWLTLHEPLPPGLSEEQWEESELHASVSMAGFTGFVLPMLLGLLGAFTYVYRDVDRRVLTATLQPGDGAHSTVRILLGMILGGLLGVVWTSGQSIQLEGVTLSLSALAFLVGFSVEVVFRVLDTLAAKVASTLGIASLDSIGPTVPSRRAR